MLPIGLSHAHPTNVGYIQTPALWDNYYDPSACCNAFPKQTGAYVCRPCVEFCYVNLSGTIADCSWPHHTLCLLGYDYLQKRGT